MGEKFDDPTTISDLSPHIQRFEVSHSHHLISGGEPPLLYSS